MTIEKPTSEMRLYDIAKSQNGYFTSRQAIVAGYRQNNFGVYLKKGLWIRMMRGVYRLKMYPISEDEQYSMLSLWVGEKENRPIGVFSHLTALRFYEVSEVISDKIHITVPVHYKTKKKDVPKVLIFHKNNVDNKDISYLAGYAITTLSKTLIDLSISDSMERDQLVQAIITSYKKGHISLNFIFQTSEFKEYIPYLTEYIQ